jgi:hypothetical protein
MSIWMVKRETNGFLNLDTMMRGGCHVQEKLLLPLTQIQRHISFPISPHHFWQLPLYFYARLRRITYACRCKLILQTSP